MVKANPAENKQLEVFRNATAHEDINEIRKSARQQNDA